MDEKLEILIDQVGRFTEGLVEMRLIMVDGFAELRQLLQEQSREQARREEERARREQERYAALDARLDRIAAAQERGEERYATLDARLDRIAAAQERNEQSITRQEQNITRLVSIIEKQAELLDRVLPERSS